jgi:predicted patatin/cPLA2 family phospholipase
MTKKNMTQAKKTIKPSIPKKAIIKLPVKKEKIVGIVNTKHIDDSLITLEDKYEHCTNKITKLIKNHKFYIGISSDVEARMDYHDDDKGLRIMYVLTTTHTKKDTKNLEKLLIKKFKLYENNINDGNGGRGVVKKINNIYMAID